MSNNNPVVKKRKCGCDVIVFPAQVENRTARSVEEMIFNILGTIENPIIIDLKQVRVLRSFEMRILVKLKSRLDKTGFALYLVHVSAECKKALEATNFDRLTNILLAYKDVRLFEKKRGFDILEKM